MIFWSSWQPSNKSTSAHVFAYMLYLYLQGRIKYILSALQLHLKHTQNALVLGNKYMNIRLIAYS